MAFMLCLTKKSDLVVGFMEYWNGIHVGHKLCQQDEEFDIKGERQL